MFMSPDRHLPLPLTSFVGRVREKAAIQSLLGQRGTRLLTLLGPAGVGKTRLALQAAADVGHYFVHGIYFVNLAPIRDPDLLWTVVTQTLGIWQADHRPVMDSLIAYLSDKQLLLILDNFEQLTDSSPQLARLLEICPNLKVLATSRLALKIRGESRFVVPPLAVPNPQRLPDVDSLAAWESISLFVQRVSAVRPDFKLSPANAQAVAEVCARLDGLPLALELAAARTQLLSPALLRDQLQNRLQLLTGGARDLLPHQRTLRATLDWSYALLPPGEQRLLRCLGVFSGNFSLQAVEAVVGQSTSSPKTMEATALLDGLHTLLDHSLLQATLSEAEPRFNLLETIREYALEHLAANGEEVVIRHRHATCFLALVEQADPQLRSPAQRDWLQRLAADYDNLRQALVWSRTAADVGDLHLRLTGALAWYWYLQGLFSEGLSWLEAAIHAPLMTASVRARSPARARALYGAGLLHYFQQSVTQAVAYLTESASIWRAIGDRQGLAYALAHLGVAHRDQGALQEAYVVATESVTLFRELGDRWGQALALLNLGTVVYKRDLAAARQAVAESVTIFRDLADPWGQAFALGRLGVLASLQGDLSEAQFYLEAGAAAAREIGDRVLLSARLLNLGDVARAGGRYHQAAQLYGESLSIYRELGIGRGMAAALHNMGYIALFFEDVPRARALFGECLDRGWQIGHQPTIGAALAGLAATAAVEGRAEQSVQLAGSAENIFQTLGFHLDPVDRVAFDQAMSGLRRQLGEIAFDALWARGQAMTPAQAVIVARQYLMHSLLETNPALPADALDRPFGLTPREVEVLCLLASGLSNEDIARRLHLSLHTVKAHLRNIYSKLAVDSRSAAMRFALEKGLC